ncbi:DinB family protein [Pontibacter sp. KCTC 32443]|uniref:DinB family protein n=1 Tax=Pontibacter TaxID=323449 RepID=UPI00164D657D|nr:MULTISPECIES: DinB family protein [Pontibacter]MBC5773239.1 DinB family protein [Pontibacter sp. KCTC 32443]
MLLQDLITILNRDLEKLYSEIDGFTEEANLWKTTGNITNPAGNLCLHLCGNLNRYIGAKLGNSGYVRDRPAEFSRKDVPKTELLKQVEQTREMVANTLQQLQPTSLEQEYPEQVLGKPMTTGFFLIHLTAHLSYHLGQINYLRRVLE